MSLVDWLYRTIHGHGDNDIHRTEESAPEDKTN